MNRLPRIYLDNCCYNRPYDDQSQIRINLEAQAKLEIQRQIRAGEAELVTSYILVAENAANRFETKRRDIASFIDRYSYLYVSESNHEKVVSMAREIMRSGVKLMDACPVACAVIAGCDYFISTDRRLLRYQTDKIKMINPITLILEMEELS